MISVQNISVIFVLFCCLFTVDLLKWGKFSKNRFLFSWQRPWTWSTPSCWSQRSRWTWLTPQRKRSTFVSLTSSLMTCSGMAAISPSWKCGPVWRKLQFLFAFSSPHFALHLAFAADQALNIPRIYPSLPPSCPLLFLLHENILCNIGVVVEKETKIWKCAISQVIFYVCNCFPAHNCSGTHSCLQTCLYTDTHTQTCMYIYTCMYTHTHTHTHMHAHTHTHTHMHTCIHTSVHTHTHTHTLTNCTM